jgi:hypothetical protein
MDTKITRLRNLMTPIVNYFTIKDKLETGDYPEDKYESLDELLYKDSVQSRKNLPEIREILKQIPDDACDVGSNNYGKIRDNIEQDGAHCRKCKYHIEDIDCDACKYCVEHNGYHQYYI